LENDEMSRYGLWPDEYVAQVQGRSVQEVAAENRAWDIEQENYSGPDYLLRIAGVVILLIVLTCGWVCFK